LGTENETGEILVDAVVEVRDAARREVDVRLLPWDTQIETVTGAERFAPGAFEGTDPESVYLYGPEHEMRVGVGQDGRPTPIRVPVGRGYAMGDDGIGPTVSFRVARTAGGDEALALMTDRIISTVSVEFAKVDGGTRIETRGGRRVNVHTRARLVGATPTHRPAYGAQAAVLAVRSKPEEETSVTDTAAPETGVTILQTSPAGLTEETFTRGIAAMAVQFNKPVEDILSRLDRIEESGRASFAIPGTGAKVEVPTKGIWMNYTLRLLSGDRATDVETRALAELITTDNLGVVPPQYSNEMIGIISPARPFLESTRKIDAGDSGMSLILPTIATRPTVGIQAAEKDPIASTTTSITTTTYSPTTIAGGGDISIQLLKRSSPQYLGLFLELLAEAYAIMADDKAVDALLAVAAVVEGGELDPDAASLGGAWANGMAVSRSLAPTHIWLSSAAVGAFIDAKASGTNAPLYSNLEANFTAGGGPGGTISGLRPVHVPALDDEAVDIIVGPSRGFVWAEDGTYTLQVDNPTLAGRDVALVGMLWFAPIYPAAFTTYTLPT
jgi:phage head maturation protease